MAEIYRNTTNAALTLDIAGATPTKCVLSRTDGTSIEVTTGLSAVHIPYSITKNDGPFEVEWTYTLSAETYTLREEHQVVTPIFTEAEFTAFGLEATAPKTYASIEKAVRYSIQAYTGQVFGYREGTAVLRGMGSFMNSNERIIEISAIDGYIGDWQVTDSGFGVYSAFNPSSGASGWRSVSYDSPVEHTVDVYYSNPINLPVDSNHYRATSRGFTRNRLFTVTGRFGWLEVPQDVRLAALFIAEELLCNQSLWRDRYVKAIRAADWRFDFFGQSMTGTGSLHADQLLNQYIRNPLVAV